MTNFVELIKTLRKDLSFIFILCLAIVLCINFWFIDIPELFKNGSKVGILIEKLCLSYISAFIFYFLVVHTKQQKDKKHIYEFVAEKSLHIISYGQTIGRDLAKDANVKLKEYYPSKDELIEICYKIDPYSEPSTLVSRFGHKLNWFLHFENYRQETMTAINEIYAKMPFLDAKLINHLSLIESSNFFSFTKGMQNLPFKAKNENLLNFSDTIFNYLNTVKEFEEFYNKNIKKYKK